MALWLYSLLGSLSFFCGSVIQAIELIGNSSLVLEDWNDCNSNYAGDLKLECAIYRAPMCYPGIFETNSSRTLDVYVKRIAVARFVNESPNVWFLQGGPGVSSVVSKSRCMYVSSCLDTGLSDLPLLVVEFYMREHRTLLDGAVHVFTMDHRGTGQAIL